MLIVCPSCATSYMIDPTSLGTTGRTVRCARCKATWFATPKKQPIEVDAFVDGVIAEAEAQTGAPPPPARATEPPPPPPPPPPPAPDDFGVEAESPIPAMASPPAAAMPPPPANAPEPVAISDAPSLVPPIEHMPLPDAASAEIES